ncbi:MAG TPA: Arc family DNA-binding protein [Rhizomicrobium sp.]
MATITVRNLPDEVRDRMRVEAAKNGRSMEEEARQYLARGYTPRRSLEDVMKRLDALNAKYPEPPNAKILMSEAHIADSRIEVLFEEGVISLEEKLGWQARIDARSVTLDEVEAFFRSRWPWSEKS